MHVCCEDKEGLLRVDRITEFLIIDSSVSSSTSSTSSSAATTTSPPSARSISFSSITALWRGKGVIKPALRLQLCVPTSSSSSSASLEMEALRRVGVKQEGEGTFAVGGGEENENDGTRNPNGIVAKTAVSDPAMTTTTTFLVIQFAKGEDRDAVVKLLEEYLASRKQEKENAAASLRGPKEEQAVEEEKEPRLIHRGTALLCGGLVDEGLLSPEDLASFLRSPDAPLHGTSVVFDAIQHLIDPMTLTLRPLTESLVHDIFAQLPVLAKLYQRLVDSENSARSFWEAVVKRYLLFERSMLDEGMTRLLLEADAEKKDEQEQQRHTRGGGAEHQLEIAAGGGGGGDAEALLALLNRAGAAAVPRRPYSSTTENENEDENGAMQLWSPLPTTVAGGPRRTEDDNAEDEGTSSSSSSGDDTEGRIDEGKIKNMAGRAKTALRRRRVVSSQHPLQRWLPTTTATVGESFRSEKSNRKRPRGNPEELGRVGVDEDENALASLPPLTALGREDSDDSSYCGTNGTAPDIVTKLPKSEQHAGALSALRTYWQLASIATSSSASASCSKNGPNKKAQEQANDERRRAVAGLQSVLATLPEERRVFGDCLQWAFQQAERN